MIIIDEWTIESNISYKLIMDKTKNLSPRSLHMKKLREKKIKELAVRLKSNILKRKEQIYNSFSGFILGVATVGLFSMLWIYPDFDVFIKLTWF